MASNLELIKKLREETQAKMTDCAKAMKECNDDYEKAVAWLRTKNLAKGEKTAEKTADEGALAFKVSADGKAITAVELTANTDFVVKNSDYKAILAKITELASEEKVTSVDELIGKKLGAQTVGEAVQELAGKIGENIRVKRVKRVEGNFGYYFHHNDREGAIVLLEGVAADKVAEVGKDLAMHVVFAKPQYLTTDEVPAEAIEKEKAIISARLKEDPKNAKKPAEILDKIASGQIGKFYGEIVLNEQPHFKENKKKVSEMLTEMGGKDAKIKEFVHLKVGG